MKTPFTATERTATLVEYAAASREYRAAMDGGDFDKAEPLRLRARQCEMNYFDHVPHLAVSCCPFDNKPLYRSFDPYGLDGLWWRSDATPEEVPSCPHFCCLRGAVNFNGRPPRGGDFQAHTGPEAPYVIPRLLEMPGVTVVLSELEMANGHTAYFIAYFAPRRPPVQQLAANWPRTLFVYTTAVNERRWRIADDAWDFDLAPWLARGKIRWCPPGDNATLSAEGSECPYLKVKGERQRRVVQHDRVWSAGLG